MIDLNKTVKHSNIISGFLAACFFIILPLFLLIHSFSSTAATLTPEQTAAKQHDLDSLYATSWAKILVKDSLKSPSTAKFQDAIDFAVAPAKDKKGKIIKDVWEVSGYVDAQNSFGAMLRNRFYIKLKKVNENNWVSLKIVLAP